jgi:LysR family transcriptional regulator, regulatory protein for tcuABC
MIAPPTAAGGASHGLAYRCRMELRQMRYFVRVAELGSMGRAAAELGVVTSALSQQISRLEGELATRLLQRSSSGVRPTEAGLAFLRQAQLVLRHADDAMAAAHQARLSGHVSIGLASSTAAVLALPLLAALRERYPEVRVHLVESLSGELGAMLNARRLDLAVVFETASARRWSVTPLLDETLFLMGRPGLPGWPAGKRVRLRELATLPLVLPTGQHGLRAVVNAAFAQAKVKPRVALEVDGLASLMAAVRSGLAATIQPGPAALRLAPGEITSLEIADGAARRGSLLASLSDDELSPAALAARVTLRDVARNLVRTQAWPGARLHDS